MIYRHTWLLVKQNSVELSMAAASEDERVLDSLGSLVRAEETTKDVIVSIDQEMYDVQLSRGLTFVVSRLRKWTEVEQMMKQNFQDFLNDRQHPINDGLAELKVKQRPSFEFEDDGGSIDDLEKCSIKINRLGNVGTWLQTQIYAKTT